MTTVALVTAVYDGYDTLKPFPEQTAASVDAVCVTDDPDLSCEGWRMIVEPRPGVHPNRAAKRPKMLPTLYSGAVRSIWIDASFEIVSRDFVAEVIAHVDGSSPVAQFVHPWRDCIYDEADASIGLAKYAGEPIAEQATWHREDGHPERWGLWATGVIARWHTPAVRRFGELWLGHCNVWSFQDQISEAPALRRCNLRPVPLPGDHLTNPWLVYKASGRH